MIMLWKWLLISFLACCLEVTLQQDEDIPHHEVKNWALKFGVDLWEFGRQFTKLNEIQKKYHDYDVQITRKDGLILIREMAAEVKNMMDIKMNALMRIMDSAEQAALPQKFDSSSPKFFNSKNINSPKSGANSFMEFNKHFDHSFINTSFSVVIIPNSVKETDPKVLNALKWSEHLDPVFVNNYEMDPGLSWQFFGSSSGFLRRFPAMKWPSEEYGVKELDDFRTNLWFVNAATSPKDIVILLDTSKSISGKTRDLAHATIKMILDTLGANDFVNIFKFSETTQEIIPCYKDLLVQGTDKNKRELRQSLDGVHSSGISNVTAAFVAAFEILHKYNRTRQGCQCNQAIMLVSDGPSSNLKDVFQTYNFPHMPVRVFTYLVGKDTSNSKEMLWMACANKGYYEHIKSFDEIRERILNYILVMARPMVMYQQDHPVSWTPAYPGGKVNSLVNNLVKEGQLMTTVSTPVFDRRNYSVRTANLLGVVGTDIPIQQIKKLVPPFKLGVNGYSFIVNNNGHVLYHPELQPVPTKDLYMEKLKPRYSNVDLSELEMVVDSEGNLYENSTLLFDLRHDMIDLKEGETEFKIKVHYDEMKRVTTRRHKYFYHPIDGTPFSLGLALPDGYGLFEINGEREIKLDRTNVTEYFNGSNWKVHPEWVYCEYNYANYMNFKTPEEQILHFLVRTKQPGWKWMSLRPRAPQKDPGFSDVKKMEHDSYFCDKSLVQSLVLDALVTNGWERPGLSTLKEQQGYQVFGVTLTFIATRSGLLRWQEHSKTQTDPKTHQFFSEFNQRAIDETWYKRAVDQHSIEPESFVFSVPFDAGNDPKTLVTATHAVFVESKGHRAPAAVVGLQFQHSSLASHFKNITSTCTVTGTTCKKTCATEDLDCYVLDNNGFIILSEKPEHTGMFFGQADGTIMDSLVQDGIYKKMSVYDYQGACDDVKSSSTDSASKLSPLKPVFWLLEWLIGQIIWFATHSQLLQIFDPHWSIAQEDSDSNPMNADDYDSNSFEQYGVETSNEDSSLFDVPKPDDSPPFVYDTAEDNYADNAPPVVPTPPIVPVSRPHNRTRNARPCHKKVDLYVLQPNRLNSSGLSNPLKGKLTNCHVTGCERPFSVQKIPHSNLILLVVDTLCPCGSKTLSIVAQEIVPGSENTSSKPTCHRDSLNNYRRRPEKCINYHPEEVMIEQCGGSSTAVISIFLLPMIAALLSIFS